MIISPRQLFQKRHTEASGQLKIALGEAWLQHAISAALAEMAAKGLTDGLVGANQFLEILSKLPEEDAPAKREPDPNLPSYGI